ncbi:MAG: hypothetical protein LC687_04165 [Actinobacteria bacterium]|nr:hypothetical protein [Actinomycetota bacterium]MCA1807030.1 hypothetical protein [Actinomycetota bacterium]
MSETQEEKFTAEKMAHEIGIARSYAGQDPEGEGDSGAPVGYVPIALSTEGNLFAPAIVHARSFKTSDMAHLSLIRADRLPENNAKVIRDVVWQETDPATWHIKEVVEFLLKHYLTYFGTTLKDVPWPVNAVDVESMKKKGNGEQFEAYQKGEFVPRVDVDLTKLQFKMLETPVKYISIKKKDAGETSVFKFRMPMFGDVITMRTYMKSEFGMRDAELEDVRKAIEETGGDLSPEDKIEYQDYMGEKLQVAANVNMALLLKEVDGKPVASLEEALHYVVEDPRFDYSLSQRLKKEAEKVSDMFGVDENLKLRNPVTEKLETRRLSFRLYDILKAILVSEPDTYDVSIDP